MSLDDERALAAIQAYLKVAEAEIAKMREACKIPWSLWNEPIDDGVDLW